MGKNFWDWLTSFLGQASGVDRAQAGWNNAVSNGGGSARSQPAAESIGGGQFGPNSATDGDAAAQGMSSEAWAAWKSAQLHPTLNVVSGQGFRIGREE